MYQSLPSFVMIFDLLLKSWDTKTYSNKHLLADNRIKNFDQRLIRF